MFFTHIEKWSKKKMWVITILCYALYFCIVILAPTIVVMTKYHLFSQNNATVMKRLTGFGLIAAVVIGITSYLFIKKAVCKLPKISVNEQRVRFGLESIFDCMPLGIAFYTMFAVKDNMLLAFSTLKCCTVIFFIAVLFNDLVIKFIDAEWDIRQGAKLDKEKEKRKDVV